MGKPYVYSRADKLGIPLVDARARMFVAVTAEDVVLAKKANSKLCALSRASMRITGVNAAYFFRTFAFLEFEDKMIRFRLGNSVQKEILSFDRAKIFAPGIYQLSPIREGDTRRYKNKANNNRRWRERLKLKPKRAYAKSERASLAAAIEKVAASEPKIDTAEAKIFDKMMGQKTHGITKRPSAKPSPDKKFVHRSQYIRDLYEPDGDQ